MSFIINKPELTNISAVPIFSSSSIEGVPINTDSSMPVDGQSLVYDSSTGKWTLIDISTITGSTGPTGSSDIRGGGVQTITFSDNDFSSTRTSFMISALENASISDENLKCYGKTTGFNNCKTTYTFGVNEQNTKWISVGDSYTGANASIAYSIDGVTWSRLTNSTGILSSGNDLDWDGNVWVAVGTPGTTSNSSIAFSRNGLDWQSATGTVDIFNHEVRSIETDGERWIAVGSTGAVNNICYSDDGIVWKPCTYTTGNLDPYCIGYNGCFWLIGGEQVSYTTNSTIVKYSYDGVTWSDNSVTFGQLNSGGITRRLTTMCWDGTKWMFGAYYNFGLGETGDVIYTISNGLNPVFSTLTSVINFGEPVTDIKWNGKIFIAPASNINIAWYLYSYNGVDWNYELSSAAAIFGLILSTEWDGTKWIAVGSVVVEGLQSTTGYSYDGINWIGVEAGPAVPPFFTPADFRTPLFTRGKSIRRNVQYRNQVNFPVNQTLVLSSSVTPSYIGNGPLTGTSSTDVSNWYSLSGITGNNASWNGKKWIIARTAGADTNTLYYSYNGLSWVGLGNTTFSTKANDCIWDGVKFIACGSGTNTIAYSYDGFVWIPSNSNSIFTECKKIYFNGDRYVSVGSGTYSIGYSVDGISWSGVSTVFTTTGNNVKYNGKIWLSFGSGTNTIAYSNNGINWTGLGTSVFSTSGNAIEWNGNRWVAGGSGTNALAYSTDGIAWTGLGTSIFTNCISILWEGKRWISVGTGTYSMAYSYDGINWFAESGTSFGNGGLAWNNPSIGKIIIKPSILAVGTSSSSNTLATSNDGIRWRAVGNFLFSNCYNINYNGKIYIAVGEGANTIAYSYDSINWVGLGNILFTRGKCISWNGAMWIAGGEGTNTIVYSYDGVHWTGLGNTVFSTSGNNVIWTGVRWIMVGEGTNQVAYSSNGTSWTPVSTAFSGGSGYGINMSSSSRIVAVGGGSSQVIYSTNGGTSWISASTTIFGVSGSGRSVLWNGNNWIATGGPTVSVATSSDGITWSSVSTDFSGGYANSVCWTGTKWIVSGDNTNTSPIIYSGDGTVWYNSDATTTLFSNCYSVFTSSTVNTTSIPTSLNIKKTEQFVITAPSYYDKSVSSPIDISFILDNN